MAPFFDIAIAGVTTEETGSAAGVLNAIQQLGGAVGVAAFGTVFFHYVDAGIADGPRAAFTDGITTCLLLMVATMAVTWLATFMMPKKAREDGTSAH
jgi:hypothetical protein